MSQTVIEALKWIITLPMLLVIGLPCLALGALWEYGAAHVQAGRTFMRSKQVRR